MEIVIWNYAPIVPPTCPLSDINLLVLESPGDTFLERDVPVCFGLTPTLGTLVVDVMDKFHYDGSGGGRYVFVCVNTFIIWFCMFDIGYDLEVFGVGESAVADW